MEGIVYLNGQYVPTEQAAISPFDRGFLFADGVYEVVRYYGGRAFLMNRHLERLNDSMAAIGLTLPADHPGFDRVSDELIARNAQPNSYVYWQVTRGTAPRKHPFPAQPTSPTLFAFSQEMPPLKRTGELAPMSVITQPETRWTRCSIKSIALLPNILAAQAATDAHADEAIFVRPDGTVTEGSARSVFAVQVGKLRTHPLDGTILPSISRSVTIELADQVGLPVEQTAFSLDEMKRADELFVVGTTTELRPVIQVDRDPIANGRIGPVTEKLSEAFRQKIITDCHL